MRERRDVGGIESDRSAYTERGGHVEMEGGDLIRREERGEVEGLERERE